MAYQQTTLSGYINMIGSLMGDIGNVYWPAEQVTYALWEGLRVWGSMTAYWRQRAAFTQNPQTTSPYYDLSQILPAVRSRSYPMWQIVQDLQYALQEPPSPDGAITGTQMTQQITLDALLNSIRLARNRFVWDSRLPLTIHHNFAPAGPGNDLVTYPGTTMYVRKLYWQDTYSGVWTTLQREDQWAVDRSVPWWTLTPGRPNVYSESEISPLTLQLIPPPDNVGMLEAVTVDSINVDASNPVATLGIPDEWVYAVKYAALAHLLNGENSMRDETRAQYAEQRYQQALQFASDFPYITAVRAANVPLPMDSLSQLDFSQPLWRNYTGYPQNCATLYDILVFNPGMAPSANGISVDAVTPAPLPVAPTDYIQLGEEQMEHLTQYVCHVLRFKCGGQEFTSSMASYDAFMEAANNRKAVLQAKIQYFEPLFGWYGREQAIHGDRHELPPQSQGQKSRPS